MEEVLEILENAEYNIKNYKQTGMFPLIDIGLEQLQTAIKMLKDNMEVEE